VDTGSADGVITVGTVTSAFAGVTVLVAFALGSAFTFGGAGAATATGAGAATVFGASDFFAAGILFDLETEEEDDIFNALVYSYHRRSSKPFSFQQR
jgi:hypothetical protein